ncbi:sulfite exporter TauE/SafE family protein [Pseudonocardia sp.]|uniref:sulfite exporter TauE/SafE family protein n=1 Tax=Pseudonocardia sp. TaxID=60912 RepID=UPI002612754F|nr:sulfite exporter TauE/SafE family protein [Pseudonocardia sp.]
MTRGAAAASGLLIGLVIGGLGGGGGVLAVPLLVYVLGQSAQDATTGSIVIVGVTALAGVLARLRCGSVHWRTGLGLAAAGVPAAALGSLLNQRVAEPVLLLSFAALTVLAAAAMIADLGPAPDVDPPARGAVAVRARPSTRAVVGCGLVIGVLTGYLGVGGGFLLVPALAIGLRMPMRAAVGTSLLVIVVNSVAAFTVRTGSAADLDWAVLVPFTLTAVLASFAGRRLAGRMSGVALTRTFAGMLLAVGGFVAVESVVALAS